MSRDRDLLLPFPPAKPPGQLNPLALAYLDDAVYETYIRQYLVSLPNHRPDHLNRQAVAWVSAKAQARLLEEWTPLLSDEERDVVRRGRNAKSGRQPKSAGVLEYRASTGFECLVGYWFLTGRLDRFLDLLRMSLDRNRPGGSPGEKPDGGPKDDG